MTQTSYFLTNGSSLEDCHTNFFALADLCGIKWRQYSCDKNFKDLNDDPILNSFAKCINANLLCVWRRIRINQNNNNTQEQTAHRDLYINYSKELWIFWYGDEPDLKELVSDTLKEGDQGSWESGLSYECRTLLFKALHNLIERCLLSKGYSRMGRWFFQSKNRDISDILKEGTQITFRFNFFLHGDSNVCANVDVRQHSAARPITKEDILTAQQIPDGIQILLSPYGVQGYLTGYVYKENDPNVQKFLSDWNKIYPLSSLSSSANKNSVKEKSNTSATFSSTFTNSNDDLNQFGNSDFSNKVVEVIVDNCRMKYPVSYVFITETDSQLSKAKLLLSSNCQNHNQTNEKTSKNLFETSQQLQKQSDEHLEQMKLIMAPYYNYLPNDTYILKNNFNQVMNLCDQTYSNADKVERNKNNENGNQLSVNELLLRKNCNCHRCQNPRRYSKSSSGSSSNSTSFVINKNKNFEKDKKYSPLKSATTTPFHHRTPMDFFHDLNSFYIFSPSSQSNIDASPTVSSINNNQNNNQTSITPINMMPYKSPVSTSTSSILNTPGVESSPMSNFNIEAHEHISPIPPSKEEINLINTTNHPNQLGSNSPKENKSTFDSTNSVNVCDSTNIQNTTTTGGPIAESDTSDQQASTNSQTTNHENYKLDKKHFKRSHRYKSIYDDDSSYKLRTGLLYDFSYETNCWEESPPKNRRFKPTNPDDSFSDTQNSSDPRDPYEFNDFDDPDFSNCSVKLNNDILESNLSVNVSTDFSMNGGMHEYQNNKPSVESETNYKSNNNTHNGNIVKNGEATCDIEFLNSPADEVNEFSNGKTNMNSSATATNDTESMITSINNSNVLGAAELLRMFPTPPSLEAMVSSPLSSTYVGSETTNKNEKLDQSNSETVDTKNESTIICLNDNDYKDSALVYMPPIQSVFITSNKYAPLENVECKNTLPPSFHYKHNVRNHQSIKSFYISQHQQNHFSTHHHQMQTNQNQFLNKSKLNNYSLATSGNKMNSFPNSMIRASRANCQNMSIPMNHPHAHMPRMRNQISPVQQQQYPHNHMMDGFNPSNPMSTMDNRRSPFLFPPKQPINSPSNPNLTLTNSSLNNNVLPSKNLMPMMGSNLYSHHPNMNCNSNTIDPNLINPTPVSNECNSLMLNLLLSDSMFNLFRDHNFESCSICVCNMNIKGNDVGIYLSENLAQQQQQQSNYNDYYNTCTCGFSAISNRHLSYFAGLFYEDEVEITGIFYDPVELSKENHNSSELQSENYLDKDLKKCLNDIDENFLKLILTQSTTIFPSVSTLATLMYCDRHQNLKTFNLKEKNIKKDPLKLIYDDYSSVILISLQMARCDSNVATSKQNMLMPIYNQNPPLCHSNRPILHEWQFRKSNFPVNNHEVMLTLKSLQPLMQESVQRKGSINEVTYNTVKGPLTWRQFHRLAGRGTECQCEPQPIPSLLVGYDKECVALSPFGLKFWEKLSLEPYSITRDVYYVVITQNDEPNLSLIKNFFKELSTAYEILRLGRHTPMSKVSSDGIYILGNNNKYDLSMDDWFNQLGDSNLAQKIRSYAQALYDLLPNLTSTISDRKFDTRSNENNNVCNNNNISSMMNNQVSMNGNVSNSYVSNSSMLSSYNNTSNQKSMNNFNNSLNNNSSDNGQIDRLLNELDTSHGSNQDHSLHNNSSFQPYDEEEDPHKYPSIMIYVLESYSTLGKEIAKFGSIGLLKTFSILKKYFPEAMKNNIHMQMLSINSVISNNKDFRDYPRQAQLKELAFAVYSQCKQQLVMQSNIKSLTGLGPAASFELFLKNRNSVYNRTQLYTTPYILAPLKDKQTELGEMFGDRREKSQILYCSYCLTEDKKWLIASCTNDKGDILHTKVININIPNRTRRKKASIRRFGLDKLMRFIQTVMAESVLPWRLVIGRLGRIGHGELKDWTFLLSKKSLLKYSRQLREMCDQCRFMGPNEQPAIYSACLISLEADTALRVFSNYYTPDERFSSSCNTCSLSTPEDASCTHILVFPTSATTQSSHTNFNLTDEFFNSLDESDIPVEDEMENFFENFWSDGLLSPRRDGPQPDSPGNRQVFGTSNSLKNSSLLEVDQDEPAQLLQQPLALAFYVSTAKTGPLPRWFWTHCPHLENICPVFLKSALLIHTPFVQQNSDDILQSNNRDCHSLDSSLTTDVLRYSLEGYNALSWLVLDPLTNDRLSCLPLHIQVLMQLYHTVQALVQ